METGVGYGGLRMNKYEKIEIKLSISRLEKILALFE